VSDVRSFHHYPTPLSLSLSLSSPQTFASFSCLARVIHHRSSLLFCVILFTSVEFPFASLPSLSSLIRRSPSLPCSHLRHLFRPSLIHHLHTRLPLNTFTVPRFGRVFQILYFALSQAFSHSFCPSNYPSSPILSLSLSYSTSAPISLSSSRSTFADLINLISATTLINDATHLLRSLSPFYLPPRHWSASFTFDEADTC
jgi:hypothetical protein